MLFFDGAEPNQIARNGLKSEAQRLIGEQSGEGLKAYELMRGVGNLCIGAESDPRYDARRLVQLLIAGLRRPN